MAARVGVEPMALRLKVINSTNAPPRPTQCSFLNRYNFATGSLYAALNIAQPYSAAPVPVPSLDKGGGQR